MLNVGHLCFHREQLQRQDDEGELAANERSENQHDVSSCVSITSRSSRNLNIGIKNC